MHILHWKVDVTRTNHCDTLTRENIHWLDLSSFGQRRTLFGSILAVVLKKVYWRRNWLLYHQVHRILFVLFPTIFLSSVISELATRWFTCNSKTSLFLNLQEPLCSSIPHNRDLQSKHLSEWQAKYSCRISNSLLSSFACCHCWLLEVVIHVSHWNDTLARLQSAPGVSVDGSTFRRWDFHIFQVPHTVPGT